MSAAQHYVFLIMEEKNNDYMNWQRICLDAGNCVIAINQDSISPCSTELKLHASQVKMWTGKHVSRSDLVLNRNIVTEKAIMMRADFQNFVHADTNIFLASGPDIGSCIQC